MRLQSLRFTSLPYFHLLPGIHAQDADEQGQVHHHLEHRGRRVRAPPLRAAASAGRHGVANDAGLSAVLSIVPYLIAEIWTVRWA